MNVVLPILTILLMCFGVCCMIYALHPKGFTLPERIFYAFVGVVCAMCIAALWGVI